MSGPAGYLDAASAEPLHPAAREALLAALDHGYADPRRLHHAGARARLVLDNARAAVAECLQVRADEVSFTPSGTHAVHLGVLGLLRGARGDAPAGRVVAHSAVEHSCVLHAVAWSGARARVLPVDRHGAVLPVEVDAPGDPDAPAVVAVQAANHEVGTVQPVADVAAAFPDAPMFVDAGASMGRRPLPEGWAVAAGSAHKWGGPAGVGVLVVRRGTRWRPPFPADDRLDERTSGFENVPAAFAAAAALQAVVAEDNVRRRQHALVDLLRRRFGAIPDSDVVGHPERRLPHLLTSSFLYVDGEQLVRELDRRGFGVDSGSACTASTLEPSHVLAAMGALTHGNVRVSLSRDTTEAEIEGLAAAVEEIVPDLRRRAGVS